MKKLLILLILSVLFLSGCGVYNLNYFVMPDDDEFLALIIELNTPRKICQYMEDNFTYEVHSHYAPTPYVIWKTGKADCNDYVTFAQFIANHHGYETYHLLVTFTYNDEKTKHSLGVYLENDKYNYSNCTYYCLLNATSFEDIVIHNFRPPCESEVISYEVYDYNNNLIEKVQR